MARIEQVEREKLTARQQQLYDDIMRTRPRGKLSGPFSVWIHRPDIAEPANALANCFRVSPKLDKRLIELIVLLVCRDANAQYAWSAHFNLAGEPGLAGEIEVCRPGILRVGVTTHQQHNQFDQAFVELGADAKTIRQRIGWLGDVRAVNPDRKRTAEFAARSRAHDVVVERLLPCRKPVSFQLFEAGHSRSPVGLIR